MAEWIDLKPAEYDEYLWNKRNENQLKDTYFMREMARSLHEIARILAGRGVPSADPVYSFDGVGYTVDADAGTVNVYGDILHDSDTKELADMYIRATFFIDGGDTLIMSTKTTDGDFVVSCVADNVIHVNLFVTDSASIVPGEYNVYASYEFDVE